MNAATNRAPRWERRKESRPAELLAAALDMFVDKGYAATRLDDVASRAGVSKGTLYLYYPSKEELFKAVVRETIVPKIDAYRREVETSAASAEQLLTNFFDAWWQHFGATELAGIIKLVVAEAGNFPEVARFFQEEVVAPNDDLLRTIVQRGIDRGEFKPIDIDAAVHIWIAPMVLKAIWMNSVEQVCPMCPDMTAERVLGTQVSMILDAIRAPRPRRAGSAGGSPAH